jgi:hypothetical protein
MATEALLRKTMGALRAMDAAGEEVLADIPNNELVRVQISRPRNPQHHRKWRALIAAIFPHQDTYPTEDMLIAAIKVALGYGDTIKLPDGRAIIVPKSLSFAKLDQVGFDAFYDRALSLILNKILPGVGKSELEQEISGILAQPPQARPRACHYLKNHGGES